MSILEQVKDWATTLPELSGWRFSQGAWTDQPGRVVALWRDGGRRDVDERICNVRMTLTGEKNTRADASAVVAAAEAIYAACQTACIGDAVRVLPVGDIVGPGYTTEGRAWAEVNLELLI